MKKSYLEPSCENFRPISDLEFVGKNSEKVASSQFFMHANDNNLSEAFQSACKEGHSTETALVRERNDILRSTDEQRKVTILVLRDLSAGFDIVDHSILLDRLRHCFGVSDSTLEWFKSYLSCYFERTISKWCQFSQHTFTCVLPEGSVAGPSDS